MLIRLSIKGFKNLVDTEVHFGPFTCVAGANASGKSNLFDAIMFLRDLAEFPIIEAASRVRDRGGSRKGDLQSLFTSTPSSPSTVMELEAEFIVPKTVKDDFGRTAKPSATHLRYKVQLRHAGQTTETNERIELIHESLTYVQKGESRKRLGFLNSTEFWNSLIGAPRRSDFISTETQDNQIVIKLRQDGGRGRALEVPAISSPRTVLGTINTEDKPTALAARRELQSWTFLQLEPSRLRLADEFSDDDHVSSDGAHLPATLARLGNFADVANKLSDLIPEVVDVGVDVDAGRRLKTLFVRNRDGLIHTARALSDGTLRFLALAIISADKDSTGVICLEEPENGIHPSRIPAIVGLLRGMAVDPSEPVTPDNPLRQVIINTHSPVVVQNLDKNDLLVALPYKKSGTTAITFGAIEGTWRTNLELFPQIAKVPLGTLLAYLTDDPKEHADILSGEPAVESVRDYARRQGAFDFMNESPAG